MIGVLRVIWRETEGGLAGQAPSAPSPRAGLIQPWSTCPASPPSKQGGDPGYRSSLTLCPALRLGVFTSALTDPVPENSVYTIPIVDILAPVLTAILDHAALELGLVIWRLWILEHADLNPSDRLSRDRHPRPERVAPGEKQSLFSRAATRTIASSPSWQAAEPRR